MQPHELALSALALRLASQDSPLAVRLLAARGIAPAVPASEVILLACVLSEDAEPRVREAAIAYLAAPPATAVDAAVDDVRTASAGRRLAEDLALTAEQTARLFARPAVDDATRALLVRRAPPEVLPRLAAMDAVVGASPEALRALFSRAGAGTALRSRCEELASFSGFSLPSADEGPAAAPSVDVRSKEEAGGETADVALDARLGELSARVAETPAHDEEREEERRVLPLAKLLETLSVSQKIRRATIGSAEERAILVRDTNRLVAEAAITSPRLQENEVLRIAANRSVSADVLRSIAESREWMKSYPIKVVLTQNPRTPLPVALRLLPMLREADVKRLSTNRSVPTAVAQAAKRELQKKQ